MTIEAQYTIPFYNDSGEAVPPFAIMQPKGLSNSGGRWFISIEKPQSDTFGPTWLVNGPSQVASGKTGSAADPSLAPVWIARASGTIAFGSGWGIEPATWKLKSGYPGSFFAFGDSPSTDVLRGLFVAPRYPLLTGETDAQYSSDVDVSLLTAGGADSGITLANVPGDPGCINSGETYAAGAGVTLAWIAGEWRIISIAECPE